jgi:hypothetical protein
VRRWADAGLSGRDGLDRPSLRRLAVQEILRLRQRGAKGSDTLPRAVRVIVDVGPASREVVQGFVDDPSFDREVGAELSNRLAGMGADSLPFRSYRVIATEDATEPAVRAVEAGDEPAHWLYIDSGDRRGEVVPLEAGQASYRLGRGPWHGSQGSQPNDVVLTEKEQFVSRRAAVLERSGTGYLLTSLDQGEFLTVQRADGRRIRPFRVRGGRVPVGPGDRIELDNGGDDKKPGQAQRSLWLRLEETSRDRP